MISKSEIKKLSELARISLSGKEEDELARDLDSILQYFEKLKRIPIEGLSEISDGVKHPVDLRLDEESTEVFQGISELVEAAPESDNGYIKVRAVFQR